MEAHEEPYVQIPRAILETCLPASERQRYTQAEAAIDLARRASIIEVREVLLRPRGKRIRLQRGELVASTRYLAKAWSWSKSAVQRWIHAQVIAGWIQTREEEKETIIRLLWINRAGKQPAKNGTENGTAFGTQSENLLIDANPHSKRDSENEQIVSGTPNGTPNGATLGTNNKNDIIKSGKEETCERTKLAKAKGWPTPKQLRDQLVMEACNLDAVQVWDYLAAREFMMEDGAIRSYSRLIGYWKKTGWRPPQQTAKQRDKATKSKDWGI